MMQELELKALWETSNERLEESLNIPQSVEIKRSRLQHYVASMKPLKIFATLVGCLWVGVGTYVLSNLFLNSFEQTSGFFLVSAALQVLITLIALIVYIHQLIGIYNINLSATILKTQRDLVSLKTSTLWVTRILFLQLPLWTTFYWNVSMLENGNWFLWILQGTVTMLFTITAVWLFFNIKYENRNKKWFRLIFNGKEWTPLMESMELLNKIKLLEN
ncbi:MAG: hypothetical protein R8G66_30700 [Cytophagales bacterium]|nr:hypothetical protein [Cytophagales bacterium]